MINILSNLPSQPGIYKMLDKRRKVIYVGKATNLKKRVTSYFSKRNIGVKTSILVENIDDIEVIITKNEEEALILENNLIKKFKPKYNILLRDDKSYPYIFVDTSHKYPTIKFYRGQKSPKKGYFFGPYTQVNKVRYMLNLLQKIFKIRSCENTFFSNRKKPCLQYQINRCDAPCMNYITSDNYNESVNNSLLLLQGKNNSIIQKFTEKMDNYSSQMKYEEASILRDKISMIRTIAKPIDIIENQGDIDVVSVAARESLVCIDVFSIRNGINLGNKQYNFKYSQLESISSALNSFIKQYYLDNIPPKKIITSEILNDMSIMEKYLSKKYNKSIKIIIAKRKPYSNWMKICHKNTCDRLNVNLLNNVENNFLDPLKDDFQRIVESVLCFDVSHLSGTNTQGSAVWFNNEGSVKSNYRRYNLSTVNKSDDYEAMRVMIKRRLKRLIESDSLPDILLVDGGKGQISQANNIIRELSIDNILVLGIVKGHKRKTDNDRILDSNFIDITHQIKTDSLLVLQRIRDEAHRFAITGQRKKQLKRKYNSKLDGIVGIGEQRKSEILKYFGGIQGVQRASIEELSKVPKINENLAEKIFNHLQNQ